MPIPLANNLLHDHESQLMARAFVMRSLPYSIQRVFVSCILLYVFGLVVLYKVHVVTAPEHPCREVHHSDVINCGQQHTRDRVNNAFAIPVVARSDWPLSNACNIYSV